MSLAYSQMWSAHRRAQRRRAEQRRREGHRRALEAKIAQLRKEHPSWDQVRLRNEARALL